MCEKNATLDQYDQFYCSWGDRCRGAPKQINWCDYTKERCLEQCGGVFYCSKNDIEAIDSEGNQVDLVEQEKISEIVRYGQQWYCTWGLCDGKPQGGYECNTLEIECVQHCGGAVCYN